MPTVGVPMFKPFQITLYPLDGGTWRACFHLEARFSLASEFRVIKTWVGHGSDPNQAVQSLIADLGLRSESSLTNNEGED